jgi:DNA helicase-2/ATP-dependent DNA helicase PcrA
LANAQTKAPEVVVQEQEILRRVVKVLKGHKHVEVDAGDLRKQLLQLRDDLNEARLVEDRAALLQQMSHLSSLLRQVERSQRVDVDPKNPYFGHMRLEDSEGRRRDILIGRNTFAADGVQIADWRDAPIARLFYQCREGEEYILPVEGRELEGELLIRRTVTIQEGDLVRVGTDEGTWVYAGEEDGWGLREGHSGALKGGAGKALRPERRPRKDKHLPEIAALLDREQYALITRPDAGMVVIQGSAGSGKTTVALHRVAFLAFQNPQRYTHGKTVVVVYNVALARYISQVLPSLGVEGVKVLTLSEWGQEVRKRAFPKLPSRYSTQTPAVVTRAKLNAAMMPMLQEAARKNPARDVAALFNDCVTSLEWWREGLSQHAPGSFTEHQIQEIYQWCSRVHASQARAEEEDEGEDDDGVAEVSDWGDEGGGGGYGDEDDEERPVKRRRERSHEDEDDARLDEEDEFLLLRLYQWMKGGLPDTNPKHALKYEHLVIDEAQDLSPVELSVLLDTVKPGAPITLSGDTAQKIVEDNDFQGWTYVLEKLGLAGVQIAPLKISYRSTAQIMKVAREVLGHLAPQEALETVHEGMPVELFRFREEGEVWAFLVDRLRDLLAEEPTASVALLTRQAKQARAAWEALQRAELARIRLVSDQDFSFLPGIEITEIHQTKGLEFDYVIVLDVDARTFPANDASRHLLHVAMTRAAYLCWLVVCGEPSPLLPAWLKPSEV